MRLIIVQYTYKLIGLEGNECFNSHCKPIVCVTDASSLFEEHSSWNEPDQQVLGIASVITEHDINEIPASGVTTGDKQDNTCITSQEQVAH